MDVLIGAAVVAGLLLLVVSYFGAIELLNSHCAAKYDYMPVTWTHMFAMAPCGLCLLVAFFSQSTGNEVVALVLAGLSAIAVYSYIAMHSSARVALAAILLLAPISFFILLMMVALLGKLVGLDDEEKSNS